MDGYKIITITKHSAVVHPLYNSHWSSEAVKLSEHLEVVGILKERQERVNFVLLWKGKTPAKSVSLIFNEVPLQSQRGYGQIFLKRDKGIVRYSELGKIEDFVSFEAQKKRETTGLRIAIKLIACEEECAVMETSENELQVQLYSDTKVDPILMRMSHTTAEQDCKLIFEPNNSSRPKIEPLPVMVHPIIMLMHGSEVLNTHTTYKDQDPNGGEIKRVSREITVPVGLEFHASGLDLKRFLYTSKFEAGLHTQPDRLYDLTRIGQALGVEKLTRGALKLFLFGINQIYPKDPYSPSVALYYFALLQAYTEEQFSDYFATAMQTLRRVEEVILAGKPPASTPQFRDEYKRVMKELSGVELGRSFLQRLSKNAQGSPEMGLFVEEPPKEIKGTGNQKPKLGRHPVTLPRLDTVPSAGKGKGKQGSNSLKLLGTPPVMMEMVSLPPRLSPIPPAPASSSESSTGENSEEEEDDFEEVEDLETEDEPSAKKIKKQQHVSSGNTSHDHKGDRNIVGAENHAGASSRDSKNRDIPTASDALAAADASYGIMARYS